MLTIFGKPHASGGFCDGVTRRDFLTIGGSLLGGPDAARPAPRRGGSRAAAASHKAIINVYLPGGPPHLDMWDLKPDAPREIRGEFNPIRTNVPGIDICELFPRIAAHGRQVHLHPLARRFRRPARRLPVHDRPQEATRRPPASGR